MEDNENCTEPLKELSLYIHIPFCVKKCLYCDFFSFSASEDKQEEYIDALIKELNAWKERLITQKMELTVNFKNVYDVEDINKSNKNVTGIEDINKSNKNVTGIEDINKNVTDIDDINKSYINVFNIYYTKIKSIFIGGGTPTCLSPKLLLKLGQAVNEFAANIVNTSKSAKDIKFNFKPEFESEFKSKYKSEFESGLKSKYKSEFESGLKSKYKPEFITEFKPEFTIEANPGTISDKHIEVFKQIGVNRISLGLQSSQDNELKKLGRIHTYNEFLESYKRLRSAGFKNINIDLMSNIPEQTIESYKDTLLKITSLNPEHISAYSLIIEPDTPFYEMESKGLLKIADEDTDRQMYQITKEILLKFGYKRYEISNYSKSGKECVHNTVYWTGGDYLGIGLSASSYINGIRFTNTSDYSEYIKLSERSADIIFNNKAGNLFHTDIEKLTNKDKMEEFMFLGLRMCRGISKQEFYNKFGKDIEEVYGNKIRHFFQNNILAENANDDRIYLTDRGIDISNYVLSEFLLDKD